MAKSKYDDLIGGYTNNGVLVIERVSSNSKAKQPRPTYRCKCPICEREDWIVTDKGLQRTSRCQKCVNYTAESYNVFPDNLIGEQYNKLKVISFDRWEYLGVNKGRARYWNCECDCGGKVSVQEKSLLSNHTKSCGCLNKEQIRGLGKQKLIDLTGQKFNNITLVRLLDERDPWGQTLYWGICDCGVERVFKGSEVKSGHTRSCGQCKRHSSYGVQKIQEWLDSYELISHREYVFSDLRSDKGGILRYDFAIFRNESLIGLIEFDGEQHFKYKTWFHKDNESFLQLQKNDLLKTNYASKKNIPLLRIKYNEEDKINDLLKNWFSEIGQKEEY